MSVNDLQTEVMRGAFSKIGGPQDVFNDGTGGSPTYAKGQPVPCIARIQLLINPQTQPMLLHVYANGTFQMIAPWVITREALQAYARAHEFVKLFDLRDLS